MAFVHHPDLEAAIVAGPDDDGGYLVYADWLQSRGDPRGELIAAAHRAVQVPADRAALRRREWLRDELVADLVPPLALGRALSLRWHLGFVTAATLDVTQCYRLELWPPALIERILVHPVCRLLRTLTLTSMHADRPTTPGA